MEREVLDRASAKQRVTHADEMRAGFMRRYFSVDWLDPTVTDSIEAKANEVLDRLSDGRMSVRFVTQAGYKDKKRDDLRENILLQMRHYPVLICPTAAIPAFRHGEREWRVNRTDAIGLSASIRRRARRTTPRGSWVTAACAEIDAVVRRAVSDWFHTANDVCGPP